MAAPQHWASTEYPKEFALKPPTPFVCAKNKGWIYFVSNNDNKKSSNGVIVFDASSQQMKRIQAYPNNTSIKVGHSFCYHPQTQKILISNGIRGKMIIYNLASKQWNEHPVNVEVGRYASMVCVADTIHIFFGEENHHHLLYDMKANSISKGVQISKHKLMHTQCVHIPNTTTVFVIGGQCGNLLDGYVYSALMYVVSFESGSAASSVSGKYTMPKPLSHVAALFVHPSILVFGGYSTDNDRQDNIYAFDIDKHEWRESSIKIPCKGPYHAVLANDQKTIHLFDRACNDHYSISLNTLLNGQVLQLSLLMRFSCFSFL